MQKVMVFGCFDPLHEGHRNFFKQAKRLGDELVVVVASDEKIKSVKHREPRESQGRRMERVQGLGLADEVILGEQSGEYTLIEKIKPDIIALGYDQKIPAPLKNKLKQYRIVRLKPYKSHIYKSSLVYKVEGS